MKLYKAQAANPDRSVPSVTMVFDEPFPDMGSLENTDQLHDEMGEYIANQLRSCLAQGTFARVVGHMTLLHAGSLVRRLEDIG